MAAEPSPDRSAPTPIGVIFRRLSDMAWRALILAAALVLLVLLLAKLRLVVLPIFVAVLLCSALAPLVERLERRGWPTLGATWVVFLGFLLVFGGAIAAIVPPTVAEFDGLGDTVEDGLNDVEDWLVNGPLHLRRSTVSEFTDDPGGRLAEAVQSSGERVVEGARTLGETLAGALLALVLTFLFLKDGRKFQRWALAHLPEERHDLARAAGRRALGAFSGFLRGAAMLGAVEGTIIGVTLWVVGAPLAAPVAILTFIGAFFPIVGAILAGALAVLVTLATVGVGPALVVLAVAVAVQQLDNDLLAPFIYGQALTLHPAVILVALTGGGALGGIAGAFLAVPVAGAVSGILAELWGRYGDRFVGPDAATLAAAAIDSDRSQREAKAAKRAAREAKRDAEA